jgi:hypothetical protein
LFSKIFLVDMDNGVDFNEFLNVFLVVWAALEGGSGANECSHFIENLLMSMLG